MDSILNTTKKQLGIDTEDDSFDIDIIVCINTVLYKLHELGIGPTKGLIIQDKDDSWDELLNDSNITNLEGIKTYIYLKTKILFDPPTNSTILEALKSEASEIEWRMLQTVEESKYRRGDIMHV